MVGTVTVRLFFVTHNLLKVRFGSSEDFRLVGGRVGMLVKDEYDTPPSMQFLVLTHTPPQQVWTKCAHSGGPGLCVCCPYDAPSPPTVLIYELSVDAPTTNFTNAHFSNVVRIVNQRVGQIPAAIAIQHEQKYLVTTFDEHGRYFGCYKTDPPTLERDVIAHLIPWSQPLFDGRNRQWQVTEKYFSLMIEIKPKWLDDGVHMLTLWEAFHAAGFPRSHSFVAGQWSPTPVAGGALVNKQLSWHAAGQRMAQETAAFVPRVYSNTWKPDFPSSIEVIDDRAIA
jgi:hypothetical protein